MYTYDTQIQWKIQQLLQWTADEYNEFVFTEGLAYLKALTPDYPNVTKQIAKSQLFWNWWRTHWQKRDQQFLEECETWTTTTEKYRVVYQNMNDGKTLQAAIYLNGQVLEESYAELIGQITKAQEVSA